jgi:putative transposase
MGRPRRVTAGGIVYHVLNRANRRVRIFNKPRDYEAFLKVLGEGLQQIPCQLLGLCLMPNHWHLVLCPREDRQLSRLMQWVTNTHVKRYREHYHDKVGGHLYQGRFRSFPVQEDGHLLTVLRYVEANPLRAKLAERAGDWAWSSFALGMRAGALPGDLQLTDWPVQRPADWELIVESRWEPEQIDDLRSCAKRGKPFGQEHWVEQTAKRLGLEATMRPLGRPKTQQT